MKLRFFITIIVTVTFYGLLGRPLVRLFSLQRDQKGIIIVGAYEWARDFAKALELGNVQVLLVDTNFENILSLVDFQRLWSGAIDSYGNLASDFFL